MNNLPRILLVDENVSDRRLASLVLEGEFGTVDLEAVGTAAEFSRALSQANFGLAIVEARFSWGEGLDLIRLVRDVQDDCPVILFTGEQGEELWSESLRLAKQNRMRLGSWKARPIKLPRANLLSPQHSLALHAKWKHFGKS